MKNQPVSSADPISAIDSGDEFAGRPMDALDPPTKGDPSSFDSMNPLGQSPKKWYVIYTKPQSEDQALEELEKKEISVFLPKIREVRFRRQRLRECIKPLFPSYLFARFAFPDDYYDVKWSRGVKRVVGSGDQPVPLEDSVIYFLKEQGNEKGVIQPKPFVKDGDRVRIKQGPLEGLWGIVRGEIDAKGRVRILMEILHAGAKVELPYPHVEKC